VLWIASLNAYWYRGLESLLQSPDRRHTALFKTPLKRADFI
jgi:hypothetical protein